MIDLSQAKVFPAVSPRVFSDPQLHLLASAHPGMVILGAAVADHRGVLQRDELGFLAGDSPARRNEYSTGRYLARACLAALGTPSRSLPTLDDGQPAWPSTAVGSITHTSTIAAAAVALSSRYSGLGLDLERVGRIGPVFRKKILTVNERRSAGDVDPTRYFAAKEAVYKCLFPLTGRKIGFHDIEIEFDLAGSAFSLCDTGRHNENGILAGISGTCLTVGQHWFACVTVARQN